MADHLALLDSQNFRSFDFTIESEHSTSAVQQLISLVRPSWNSTDTEIKELSTGFSNNSFVCSHGEDKFVVRVFGKGVELFVDRQKELAHGRLLAIKGLGPSILCSFSNGFVYRFVQGEMYLPETPFDEESARAVCKAIVNFNTIDMSEAKSLVLSLNNQENIEVDDQPSIFQTLYQMWGHCAESLEDEEKDKRYRHVLERKQEILSDIKALQTNVELLNLPVIFAHGDWRNENLIADPTRDTLLAVDFEMSEFSYEPHDLAFYFSLGNFQNPNARTFDWGPTREQELLWVRIYLECRAEYSGKNPKSVSEEDIQKWHALTMKMLLVCYFKNMMYCWTQATRSTLPVDFMHLLEITLAQYDCKKKEIMALEICEEAGSRMR